MACFTLAWLENLLIWLIILGAVVGLIKLVLPLVLTNLGVAGGTIVQALSIVMWAIIAIWVVIFIFDLIQCLAGAGGLSFPRRP
jgi:hypothetical protein